MIILVSFLFLACNVKAQSAYHGGKGDGYAMASTSVVHVSGLENNARPELSFRVYPSPALSGNALSLEFDNMPSENISIQLCDVSGRICEENKYAIRQKTISMDLPMLAPGIYILRVVNNESVSVKKILITEE